MPTDNHIFKSDDIGAFGGKIKIDIINPNHWEITRAEFECGSFYIDIKNPEFPLIIKPTRIYTKDFDGINTAHLRVYDKDGLRKTCRGTMKIFAEEEVIKHEETEENGLCC